MKKILILAVFTVSVFIVSCGGGKSSLTDDDRDETDSVSDASGSTDDSGDHSSDDGGPDGQPDDSENSISDQDSEIPDSTSDEDSEQVYVNPCDSDPCDPSIVENATGECIESGDSGYFCKCEAGYKWTGSLCQFNSSGGSQSIGNICTGQTSCYDASYDIYVDMPVSTASIIPCPSTSSDDLYGQDAWYASLGYCVPQSFSPSSDVVVDNNTGLTWEKSLSAGFYIWEDRAEHCNELNTENYAGKSDWRVPNPLELLTVVDNGSYSPAINSDWTEMPADNKTYLWTSKESKNDTSYAYAFRPYDGMIRGGSYDGFLKTNSYKVLCVSGKELLPASSADFTESPDGETVTDNRTGLMWLKTYDSSGGTWKEAIKFCEDLDYAGYSDWRLPNKNELVSLLDYDKSDAPYSNFPGMHPFLFWSSSTAVADDDYLNAWSVDFGRGDVTGGIKIILHCNYARCVR